MPKKAIKTADETKENLTKTVKKSKTTTTSAKTTKKVATKSTSKKAIASEKKSTTAKVSSEAASKKTTAKKKVATTSSKVATKKTSATPKTDTKKSVSKKSSTTPKSKQVVKSGSTISGSKETKSDTKKENIKTTKTVIKKNPMSTSTKQKGSAKSKKVATKVALTKKVSTVSKTKSSEKTSLEKYANVLEYYDLPYRYNETVVKILAQTPKVLFVYWDISDSDRDSYSKKYGEYFFNDTYPVLIVHNKTLNYTEEVEINDFANSWYISIPDSRSEYTVELGRRFKEYAHRNPNQPHKEDINKIIPVATSNEIIMPNDHVLLSELKPEIKYRNVKTGEESVKSITHILADKKLVDFYNLYQKIYQVEDINKFFNLDNPSSGNPTSTFK